MNLTEPTLLNIALVLGGGFCLGAAIYGYLKAWHASWYDQPSPPLPTESHK